MKKSCKKILSLLSLCLTLPGLPAMAAECSFPKDVTETAQEWLAAGHGTGVVMATVDSQGVPCYRKMGKQSATGTLVVDENTLFEIGSITKVFTALALARLVEQGQVKLSDSYSSLLPEAQQPKGADRDITLEDLATHRSGLPRLPDNFKPQVIGNPYVDYSPGQLWDFLAHYTLPRKVGSQYEYSNLGFGLLGQVLSHKAGKSYEAMVKEQVIQPLGLKDTGISLNRTQLFHFAQGYVGLKPVPHWDDGSLAGAYVLRSSAADLVSLLGAAMGSRKTSLDKAFALTELPHFETQVKDMQVGLAWHLQGQAPRQIVFHNGGTGGFLSFMGFNPTRHQGVVVLANSGTFPVDEIAMHLLDSEKPLRHPHKEISLSPEQLEQLTGSFYFPEIGLKAIVRHEGTRLLAGFVGQGELQLHPETPTRFFLTEVEASLEFIRDGAGKITGLKLTQNGQSFLGKPVK